MDQFDSVYRKHYRPYNVIHKVFKQPPTTRKGYSDPFLKYLVDTRYNKPLEPGEQLYSDYGKKQFTKENAELAKIYLSNPINDKYLQHYNYHKGNTTYQTEFCYNLEEQRLEQQRIAEESAVHLPEDTRLPATSYLFSYRNPSDLSSSALKRVPAIPQGSSLDTSKEINEILQVVTGETEYGDVIGKLGKSITEDQIHGKIIHKY